jgi:HK97 gp10 family phage protein
MRRNGVSVELELNLEGTAEFQNALETLDLNMNRNVRLNLANWAAQVEASARQLVPVRTGYLRSTIHSKTSDWQAEVSADAPYALAVELGTRHMRSQPYLEPALQMHLAQLEQTVFEAINTAAMEAGL